MTICVKKALGSYNRSIKLPPKIRLNLPKDLSKLQASPTINFTLSFRCGYELFKTWLLAFTKAADKSDPIT